MHAGMGGPHLFVIHVKTNDPVEPERQLRIRSNWGGERIAEVLRRPPEISRQFEDSPDSNPAMTPVRNRTPLGGIPQDIGIEPPDVLPGLERILNHFKR